MQWRRHMCASVCNSAHTNNNNKGKTTGGIDSSSSSSSSGRLRDEDRSHKMGDLVVIGGKSRAGGANPECTDMGRIGTTCRRALCSWERPRQAWIDPRYGTVDPGWEGPHGRDWGGLTAPAAEPRRAAPNRPSPPSCDMRTERDTRLSSAAVFGVVKVCVCACVRHVS